MTEHADDLHAASRRAEAAWLRGLPKVELHLHLEGAIPHHTLWQLIAKYGGDPDVLDLAALERRFVFRDFAHFIDTWIWKNRYLREYEDFAYIAEAVAAELVAQGVRYAEVFFSPADFARHALEPQGLATAIRRGLDRVPGVEVALIADLVRDMGPEAAERTLAQVSEVRDQGVIGIGLGGSEQLFPPELFMSAYRKARALGFRTTAHAGEAAGAESVWGAVRALEAERIGHGTRSVEDPRLVDHLAERRIPVEACPISNLRTGVISSLAEHPIRELMDRGVIVSVNSDDPTMFGTSITSELGALRLDLGFSRDEIRSVIVQAIESSWLSLERKLAMVQTFTGEAVWSEEV